MSTIKIQNMTTATTLTNVDWLMIVQGNINKKISSSTLLNNLNSNNHIRINPLQLAISFSVATKNDANTIYTSPTSGYVGLGTASPTAKLQVEGNIKCTGVNIQSTETVQYTTTGLTLTISPIKTVSTINCINVSGVFTLSNGFDGQLKTIVQNTLASGQTSTISLTGLGFNTITFNTLGDSVMVQFVETLNKWALISNNGATISTV